MPVVLDINNLCVDIRTPNGVLHAVRNVSLHVDEGEVLGIVGESGCGKSITSMGVLDLLPKAAVRSMGTIHFLGKDLMLATEPEMRAVRSNQVGVIFQDPMTALNPTYTIGDQLTEVYLAHRRSGYQEAEERAIFLLDRVGITAARNRLKQYPHQLSGGLRQRVVIALALMCEPRLIIADEPTTALDVTIQGQILNLIKGIQTETGASLIMITHDLGVIAQVADRVAVMYAGEVVETGTVVDIFNHPQHPYTRGLMACIPTAGQTGKLGQIRGMVPSLFGDIEGCVYRTRCDFANSTCRDRIPVNVGGNDHTWKCVHATLWS